MTSKLITTLIVIFTAISSLPAQEKRGLKVQVELSPAGSFEITGNKFKGTPVEKHTVGLKLEKMIIPLESLKTGIDLRDEHLKKRLKNDVVINNVVANGGIGKGTILINDIAKEFEFKYDHPKGKYIKVNFSLKPSDFAITDINYMGVGVKDSVAIEATILVKEK